MRIAHEVLLFILFGSLLLPLHFFFDILGRRSTSQRENYTFIKLCFPYGHEIQLKLTDYLTCVSILKFQILRPFFMGENLGDIPDTFKNKGDVSSAISPKIGLRK